MPLMPLDATLCHKRRYWRFLVASLALHAGLLGLGEFCHDPAMRFFSPEDSLSVSIVASGLSHNVERVDEVAESQETVSVKEVERSKSVSPSPRKIERKKKVTPQAITSAPQNKAASEARQPAEKVVAEGADASVANFGAAVERTIGEGDAPSFARFVPPEYPHQARSRNMEGRVLLRVLVGVEGMAKEIEVVESSHPAFAKAARKSAQRSRYVPLMRQGCPEEVWVLIPFQFKLK